MRSFLMLNQTNSDYVEKQKFLNARNRGSWSF